MRSRPVWVLFLSVSILAVPLSLMEAAEPREWPTRWNVNGNGATGHLEFSIRDDGSLEGRLLGQSIEGYVSGRHLFMRRVIDDMHMSEITIGYGMTETTAVSPSRTSSPERLALRSFTKLAALA